MSGRLRRRAVAFGVALLLVGALGTLPAEAQNTTAAWTDRHVTSGTVTAGIWQIGTNSCTAYSLLGIRLSCSVTGVQFTASSAAGVRSRTYSVNLRTSSVLLAPRTVMLDVDLRSAGGAEGPEWSWTNAGIATGSTITTGDGWTCRQLPRVVAEGKWAQTIQFTVIEQRTAQSTICP
ncbi:SipW-dependent-type signal peptide-containing protein [Microbacterium sp. NPDC058345]|uniref:SipW-dependent-type signal peptide-containing protein n=1 Tax=Microbacterium sp. NPDC058345 TaxID=3346455 RepID=UPI003654D7BE